MPGDLDDLIQRLRVAIYDLCVQAAICATDYSDASQRRLDDVQAELDAVIQEVADAIMDARAEEEETT